MNYTKELFDFIRKSPTAHFTVNTVKEMLLSAGYTQIQDGGDELIADGGKYFVVRGGTSVVAFRKSAQMRGFMICASHSDSPSFRVKQNGEKSNAYSRLDVEKYGGMIYYSWLDRPLSVAGRVVLRTADGLKTRLVNLERDVALIPSLAIHLNRNVNDGLSFNPAVDMLPVIACGSGAELMPLVADELGVRTSDIISHDLFLYCREEGRVVGAGADMLLCPRLDDLECVFASTKAFIEAEDTASVPVLAVFDNEEVGSSTSQGAGATLLYDTLMRVAGGREKYCAMLANSFMVSADNAHARHPNQPQMSDEKNAPLLGSGVVIKHNASQRYATDGIAHGIFSLICERAGVPTQTYYNRADLPGGSTLGSISNTRVSLPTVDIGLPQLAMHSAVETASVADLTSLVDALTAFYATSLYCEGDEFRF